MLRRNKPEYNLVLSELSDDLLLMGGPIAQKERQEIINATYRRLYLEHEGYEINDMQGYTTDAIGLNATQRAKNGIGAAVYKFVQPEGRSLFGILVTALCFAFAYATGKGYLPDPVFTSKLFTLFGESTQNLSWILLILSLVFALPMIHRYARILFLGLCAYIAIDAFSSGMRGPVLPWVTIVVLLLYYRLVRRQMKGGVKQSEQQIKAAISQEVDRHIWELQHKVNRRNV